MNDKELINMAIIWFENISRSSDELTTGNVSHNKNTIKRIAIAAIEYIEKHRNG